MINKIIFLLIFQFSFAQKPIISVTITDIKTENLSSNETQYTVSYTVKNNSDQSVKFFFNPDDFGLSMSTRKIFMLYENGIRFEGDKFLKTGTKDQYKELENLYSINIEDTIAIKKRINLIQKLYDFDVKTANQGDFNKDLVQQNTERYKNDVLSFGPNESRTYVQKLYWHKNRYYKNDDLEYYLNENSTFEISFALILMKRQLKEQLSNDYFLEIMKDENFIEGVFLSNKMVIEFKE